MNISIIGTGIYSTALALNMAINNHNIIMWSENAKLVKNFNKHHNLKPITNALIPSNIRLTNNIKEALENSDLILIGTSVKYVRSVCEDMKNNINTLTPICIASKGIENDTCAFLSDIVRDILHSKNIAVISGPTFAIDLINNEPCALSLASTSKKASQTIINALQNNHLKLQTNNDLYGTEICGCIKNVIAIASGILEGLGYSESTKALLLTETTNDIKDLLSKLECNPNTILTFAGIGDLILTASSPKSRNYKYGVLLGQNPKKQKLNEYLKNNTTEGYYTLLSMKELIKKHKINMSIINIIYDIAINNKSPEILSEFLVTKD